MKEFNSPGKNRWGCLGWSSIIINNIQYKITRVPKSSWKNLITSLNQDLFLLSLLTDINVYIPDWFHVNK